MTSKKENKRRQTPLPNKDRRINNPETGQSNEAVEDNANEPQRRVRFTPSVNTRILEARGPNRSVDTRIIEARGRRQERVAGYRNHPKITARPNNLKPLAQLERTPSDAKMKTMTDEEKQLLDKLNELPAGSDLSTSYVPHYRNSFPEHPPLPSAESKHSLLLRETLGSVTDKLDMRALQLEEFADEFLTPAANGTESDEMGGKGSGASVSTTVAVAAEVLELMDGKEKDAIPTLPPKAPRPPHIKLNVKSRTSQLNTFVKDNKLFNTFRNAFDQKDKAPIEPLRLCKVSDGKYNQFSNDKDFGSASDEEELLSPPDSPVPDIDDMRISPHLNTYHRRVSGKRTTQTPSEYYNDREKRLELAKEKIAVQKLKEKKKKLGEKGAGRQDMGGDAKGGLGGRGNSRGEGSVMVWEGKVARGLGAQNGYGHHHGHGHELGNGDGDEYRRAHDGFELQTGGPSPKRKREQSPRSDT